MSEYSLRLAQESDKAIIVSFMDKNWGSEHPLIHNDKLFKHYYVNGDKLQFALCFKNDVLCALCGYILANQCEQPDIWVSIWLALKGENGAGLELMSALPSLCGARVMSCNNIRPKTMPFYTFLGYTAARLPHYYRLLLKPDYKICNIKDYTVLPVNSGKLLKKISGYDELEKCFTPYKANLPFKDLWYIKHRYFDYPYFNYDVWTLDGSNADALLVTRTVEAEGVNVIRIVDYIGDPLYFSNFGYGIDNLMKSTNAEYADIYCFGISPKVMADAGFSEREESCVNIIPNYLSPPLYENTEYYFFTTEAAGFTMFKADGDQDRPNL